MGSMSQGGSSDMQIALQASVDLQQAIEASAVEARTRLASVMDLYQAKIRPVEADGNCQFRALAAHLYGDEARHAELRALVVRQLQAKPQRYAPYVQGTYDEYTKRMARDTEWGDNVTLQAASDVLGREIHVLTDKPGSECIELRPLDPIQ